MIVDDDPDVLQAATLVLQAPDREIVQIRHPEDMLVQLRTRSVDVIVLDLNYRRGATDSQEGLAWLSEIKRLDADAAVVVITAHAGIALAVEAVKRGATDFIAKPWSNERFATTVGNALQLRATQRTAARLQLANREMVGKDEASLIGDSLGLRQVHSLIARAAPTDANVLILGENGTGKELVARALYRASMRSSQALVSVDLGAISANLFESELFGHKKGAFTDAKIDRIGRFQAADGGTLFLDEIGNLPLTLQPKLLSALEQRQVTPVGANTSVKVDVRLLCATNLSRDQLADEKQFRADLLFRLNTVEIHLPPLRQRRDDIASLITHFLALYNRKYSKPIKPIDNATMAALIAYDWPGNIRALRHAVERAVILASGANYTIDDFALPVVSTRASKDEMHSVLVGATSATAPTTNSTFAAGDFNLDRIERQTIERALQKHAWNISLAARELGLTRASLYRRMERHAL